MMKTEQMPERISITTPSEMTQVDYSLFWVSPPCPGGEHVVKDTGHDYAEYVRADVASHITLQQAIYIQCKLNEMTCLADETLSNKAKTCLENIDFEQTSVYNYYVDSRAYSENIESINSLQAVYQDALYFTEQYEEVKKALANFGAHPLPERQAYSPHDEYLDKFPTAIPTTN